MRSLSLALLALAACAGGPRASSEVHPRFAQLRPAMVAVRTEGPEAAAGALAKAAYRELLGRDYSVLAPGAPAGLEAGFLRARLTSVSAPWDAEAVFEDPAGRALYRARIQGFDGTVPELAAALLADLPPKR